MAFLWEPNASSLSDCTVVPVRSRRLVQQCVREWHRTHPYGPQGWRVAFAAYAPNGMPVAVATWGRPVARNEDQQTTLELTRFAISPYAPRNLGTWMLARMRRWIKTHMPGIRRLISYSDANEVTGALYKADNWQPVAETFSESPWAKRPGRKASERQHKIKWERGL